MSRISDVFAWLKTCPQLTDMFSIAATEEEGVYVVLPQGSSSRVAYNERTDTLGGYECDVVPFPSVYEDYQINCYSRYDPRDGSDPSTNFNVLTFDEVQAVCDWVAEQDEAGNMPEIEGERVVSVECNPFVPQIRYVNEEDRIVAYFITLRVRYVNRAKARSVYYGDD